MRNPTENKKSFEKSKPLNTRKKKKNRSSVACRRRQRRQQRDCRPVVYRGAATTSDGCFTTTEPLAPEHAKPKRLAYRPNATPAAAAAAFHGWHTTTPPLPHLTRHPFPMRHRTARDVFVPQKTIAAYSFFLNEAPAPFEPLNPSRWRSRLRHPS